MESNWRLNIAIAGAVDGPFRLIARYLPPFEAVVLVSKWGEPRGQWYTMVGLPEDDFMQWGIINAGFGPGEFPYGQPVQPD